MQALQDFILDWNKSHKRFFISATEAPATGRPTKIDIRFSAARYQRLLSFDAWERLRALTEAMSHGILYVTSDSQVFTRGVVDIDVASANHNYREDTVVAVLRWICTEFFPNRDE